MRVINKMTKKTVSTENKGIHDHSHYKQLHFKIRCHKIFINLISKITSEIELLLQEILNTKEKSEYNSQIILLNLVEIDNDLQLKKNVTCQIG